jgi:SPP1 gp7 family putative phage head morphogenesis protein
VRYSQILGGLRLASMKELPADRLASLKAAFSKMMKALYRQEGASFKVELMRDDDVRSFIDEHASVLDSSFGKTRMSDTMRRRLQESDYVFSGIKTFHELNEAFPSLLDEKGERKPFERFLNDVQTIDRTYNRNYLRTEYNFVSASSEMAGRWEDFEKDGDEYWLQYRTAGDDRVRPEHAALNGVTLPPSDPFWDVYYPPNGWNCRCTVVQVPKNGRTQTPHEEAMTRGAQAMKGDKRHMFAWNPGKEGKSVPDYNPYTIPQCRNCDVAKGKMSLSKPLDCDLCKACRELRLDSSGDVTELLKSLHEKRGADYIQALRDIVSLRIFKKTDVRKVWSAIGEDSPDYGNLFSAAGKLANHGFEVFILPNPGSTRSGDFIMRKKNFIGLYDLKTITGLSSVGNRLADSKGQANRIVLNIISKYNPKSLTKVIRSYFYQNNDALEVKVLKGNKLIDVKKSDISEKFDVSFVREYVK